MPRDPAPHLTGVRTNLDRAVAAASTGSPEWKNLTEAAAFVAENVAAALRADSRTERSPEVAERYRVAAVQLWGIGSRCRGAARLSARAAVEELRQAHSELIDVRTR